MYLTLSDAGVRKLDVHGPPGTKRFVSAGGAFCENRPESDLVPSELDMAAPPPIVDAFLSVQPIPVLPPRRAAAAENGSKGTSEAARRATPPPADPSSDDDADADAGGAGGAATRVGGLGAAALGGVDGPAVSYLLRFVDEEVHARLVRGEGRGVSD
jgi:hypothetical protein